MTKEHPIVLANAYKPWSKKEEDRLTTGIAEGASLLICCAALHRSPGAIIDRAKKLGIVRAEYYNALADTWTYVRTTDGRVFCTSKQVKDLSSRLDMTTVNPRYLAMRNRWKYGQ